MISKEFNKLLDSIDEKCIKNIDLSKITESEKDLLLSISRNIKYDFPKHEFSNVWAEIYDKLEPEYTRKNSLTCSVCGNSAKWNVPYMDVDGNIYCDTCDDDVKDRLLYGIDQHMGLGYTPKMEPTHLHYSKNGVILSCILNHFGSGGNRRYFLPKFIYSCWSDGGRTSWKIDEIDAAMIESNVEKFLDYVRSTLDSGVFKCSSCGGLFPKEQIAGYPLFTGINCPTCYEKHLAKLDEQRREGHVCRMCGQPYGNCSC